MRSYLALAHVDDGLLLSWVFGAAVVELEPFLDRYAALLDDPGAHDR